MMPSPNLNIPEETVKRFPELIPMIQGSRSMNDEERQYWIDALPVMTSEQIKSLENILVNEKKQLAEVEKNYQQKNSQAISKAENAFNEAVYREKKRMLKAAEAEAEAAEKSEEEKVLADLAKI